MIWNSFLLALRAIRRNVLRSFLTILGIVIGVAAVIIMVTIGNGATAKVKSDISKLGSNMLMIRPGQHHGPGGGPSDAKPFEMKDVKLIESVVSNLRAVAPSGSKSMTVVFGNDNWVTNVTGTINEYFIARDWKIISGREFTDTELKSGHAVCIIGNTLRKELFGNQNPIGNTIRLQKITCEVIGTLETKGQSGGGFDQDDQVIVPLEMFQRRISGNNDINSIMVSVKDEAFMDKANKDIVALLREKRHISSTGTDDFNVHDLTEIANTMSGVTKVLTTLLGSVAAVSLIVGGIGIMNIMLVSVTERTREIGTRLAIGALEKDVLTQFLVEAIVLSSFGGIIGIILALSLSVFLANILGVPFIFNLEITILAFLFSGAVGVVFGYFPARKAASLDPIEALRYE
jgi:putative ABC transport system permease protein